MSATISVLCLLSAATGAAVAARRLSRRQPPVAGGPVGRAAPGAGRVGPLAAGAAGLGAGLIGLSPSGAALVLGLSLMALAALALAMLRTDCDVVWTPDGLEGPSTLLPPPFGPRRDFLLWRDLRRLGRAAPGTRFVEDADGNRIVWSWLYAGEGHLLARLETVRPDLLDSGDEDDDEPGRPHGTGRPEQVAA